jgi:hypothetical protein
LGGARLDGHTRRDIEALKQGTAIAVDGISETSCERPFTGNSRLIGRDGTDILVHVLIDANFSSVAASLITITATREGACAVVELDSCTLDVEVAKALIGKLSTREIERGGPIRAELGTQ